ncbi:MAG: sigma-54-dependent Fis family transcriptional regulator [Bacteroidaceae bacterium]|nr:sigma-54-dependent Fis family transcriptional regulator [Bacteroidaceae bacterium]
MSNISDMQTLMNRYGIVGRNEALREALATAVLVAPTDLSVLIQGESGVGKEVIPRIIHDHSKRRGKTYIAINCGSIPEGTIDSELFGHEKGAFTSAIGEHEGYFGAADGGTLFLDEVGELPLSTQARLLRVLETGEYLRVGSSTPRKTDVRIVAATNVDIPNAIKQGLFREDLYYRLCTINIKVPPLRKRQGDAVLLFKKFAMDTAERYRIPEPIRLTPEAEAVVNSYKWPGNIRQLRNITEQLSILSESRNITPEILAKHGITPNSDTDTSIATIAGNGSSGTQHDYEQEIKILAHAVFELRSEVQELKEKIQGSDNWHETPADTTMPVPISPQKSTASQAHSFHTLPGNRHSQPLDMDIPTAEEIVDDDTLNIGDMEKRNILLALQRNHYKRKLAAEELGISERTLYRKIKAYGIDE